MKTLEDQMREWLLDCFEEEEDHEEIQSLTQAQLIIAVNKYYDGGITAFMEV